MIKQTDQRGKTIHVCLEGRFDRETEDELERLVAWGLDGVDKLCIDMKGVKDISSIGLRILSYAQKIMNEQGAMYIENAEYWVEYQCREHDIMICTERKET